MTSAASRRALVRAYETNPRSEVAPECADDHCADYEVMDSSDSVNALLHEAEKLQEYMDALSLARPRNGSDDGELYMKLRGECAELISDGFGDEVDPFTLLDGEISADTVQEFMEAVEAYKLEFLDITDDDTRTLSKTEEELAQAWSGVFMHSLVMRYRIMELAVKDPHALRMLFGTEYMTKPSKQTDLLPDTLKMVAAFDINRGVDKSIILRTHADPSVREYDDQSLLSYYRNQHPNVTLEIRNDIRCMALGVGAAGGRICERVPALNGLCWMDADRIDLSLFSTLQTKIESILDRDRKNAIADCIGWARSRKDPKVFDPTHVPQTGHVRNGDAEQRPSKRAASRLAREESDGSQATTGEANAPRIHRWNIRVGNEITLEVDRVPSEELLLDDTVEQLMQYGVLADYLKRHDHQEGLVKFMRKALRAILDPDEITERSIERMRDVNSIVVGDHKEKVYRLSGAKLPGVGGGRIAKDTRLVFSAVDQEGIRNVTFLSAAHRSDSGYCYGRANDLGKGLST